MINLQNVHLTNEEIIIDDRLEFSAIGKTAVLENCIVRCMVPAKCFAIHGTLRNSTIIAERELKGFSWLDATLLNCTFQGIFKENNFGTMSDSQGACKSGIFTDADLDDCYFIGNLDESHRFPTWPNFVLLHPHLHASELKDRTSCSQFAEIAGWIKFLHKEVSAMAFNAHTISKRLKVDIDGLRNFLSHFDFVKT